jgi:hypothetical protein
VQGIAPACQNRAMECIEPDGASDWTEVLRDANAHSLAVRVAADRALAMVADVSEVAEGLETWRWSALKNTRFQSHRLPTTFAARSRAILGGGL